jgi:transcriptional regulator with XRE-family HTH domain
MDEKILKLFGQKVRQIRLSKNVSQETLAEMANLHRTYISDVERGTRNISLSNAEKIAKALNVSLTDLLR